MDIYIIIVSVIVSLTLIAILFFALRSTVKRIDYNTRKYFVDKLQDYDYLIDEKKKILDELSKKIEENKKNLSEESNENKQIINAEKIEYYENSKLPKYLDEDLFKKYKDIKNKFLFNEEELIGEFVSNIQKEKNNDYEILVNLRKKLTRQKIYEIIKLRPKDQKKYINELLTQNEFDVISKYINLNSFKINKFITKIDTLIEKNDPVIYIYTGEENKNYDYIDPAIKTQYDNNINEGIKISYKGILYDYSI